MRTGLSVTARVIPGNTKLLGPVMSMAGNQPSLTEKMNTSTTPSQNAGVAWARATNPRTTRSNGPLGRRVAAAPNARASSADAVTATPANANVLGRAAATASLTDWAPRNDVPRSPWRRSPR